MAWQVPSVFLVGQVLRALDMNNIGTDLSFLYNGGLTPIYDTTLSGSAASIDITSIPGTWAHLLLILYARGDVASTIQDGSVRFNNDSGSNYDSQYATTSSSSNGGTESLAASSATMFQVAENTSPANTFTGTTMIVPHYSGSSNNKTIMALGSGKAGTSSGNLYSRTYSGFWRSNATITRITLLPGGGNFVSGTRATLYGLGVST